MPKPEDTNKNLEPEEFRLVTRRKRPKKKKVRGNVAGECFYCGEEVKKLTKDHIIPKSKGGTITVPACLTCNQMKHNLTLGQFIEKMILILKNHKYI